MRVFLRKYAGSYQEDRMRNDWLLLLGQVRDWATFMAEYPGFRMNDDREVRCYALLTDFNATGADVAAQVQALWLAQRDADDGCAHAAEVAAPGAQDEARGGLATGPRRHGVGPPVGGDPGHRPAQPGLDQQAQDHLLRSGPLPGRKTHGPVAAHQGTGHPGA